MARWLISALALVIGFCFGQFAGAPASGGRTAEIEDILRGVRLPEGFSISLYALAPGARTIAVGPRGDAIFVGTGAENKIYVITPGQVRAAAVAAMPVPIRLDLPHGLCFSPDGTLYVAERNRIVAIPHAETQWRRPRVVTVVKLGDLIPKSEESDGHTMRVCRIGFDEKLYVSLGQPYDVTPRGKLALYERIGIGGVLRMNPDGSGREVFARGIRNSVGMDFNPADGSLWFTDNQPNEMGADTPPGEINRADRAGLHFGFPWFGGGHVRTPDYAGETPPAKVVFPEVEETPHAADLGMAFYTGTAFPKTYRGGFFSAQHGSVARDEPVGARVMFTRPGPGGRGGVSQIFAEGWNRGAMPYLGRPVDVAQAPDGALLVTDDQNGAVYRIAYGRTLVAGR